MKYILSIFISISFASCLTVNVIPKPEITCTVNNVVMEGIIVSRIGLTHLRIQLSNGHIVIVNRHSCKI